jgi:hypothetical protein
MMPLSSTQSPNVSTFLIRRASALALAIFLLATSAAAQQVALRELPKPAKEIDDPFSLVSGAMEFRGGQLLVIDGVEMEMVAVDFTSGSRTTVGRQGSGPGEYRAPAGLFRIQGDSLWVLDAAQQRIVVFNPDLKPGTTFPFLTFDQQSSTAFTAPFFGDRRGRLYASSMAIQAGRGATGVAMKFPDSVGVVRVDPRDKTTRTELARVRFPASGNPEMKQEGNNFKYTMAYPGLVASDPWAVFPDGRIAVLRGASYSVEFITPDGKHSTPVRIAYERFKVTDADRKAEMDEVRRQMAEQSKAVQKMMPPNVNMTFEILPPAEWPAEYPPVSALGALAGPDGRLWVKRAVPVRVGREQWDVIDQSGKLIARWQLPRKTTLVAVGQGVVYTVRTDEDDLRYVQRVEVPR